MHSRIGCICLTFLHCASLNVFSNRLPVSRQSHIGCICLAFLHCAFSNVSPNCVLEKRHSHTGYICLTFLHCAFLNVSSNGLHENMQSNIGCICLTFLHCVLKSKSLSPKMHPLPQQTTSLSAILQLEGHQPHAQGRPLVQLNLELLTPQLLMEDWQNMIPKKTKKGVNVSNRGGQKCQT